MLIGGCRRLSHPFFNEYTQLLIFKVLNGRPRHYSSPNNPILASKDRQKSAVKVKTANLKVGSGIASM